MSSLLFSSRRSESRCPSGGRSSRTRIVIRIAITPSVKAFMRSGFTGRLCHPPDSLRPVTREEGKAMRAVTLESFDSPLRVRDDLPVPEPGGGELLVRVHASSINPADGVVAAGTLRGMFEYDFPVTIGTDFAGVVEAVGPS